MLEPSPLSPSFTHYLPCSRGSLHSNWPSTATKPTLLHTCAASALLSDAPLRAAVARINDFLFVGWGGEGVGWGGGNFVAYSCGSCLPLFAPAPSLELSLPLPPVSHELLADENSLDEEVSARFLRIKRSRSVFIHGPQTLASASTETAACVQQPVGLCHNFSALRTQHTLHGATRPHNWCDLFCSKISCDTLLTHSRDNIS